MSDHRHAGVKDHKTEPGRRASRRAGDDGGSPPGGYAPPRGRGRKANQLSVSAWISVGLTCVMVLAVLGGYKFYRDLDSGIKRVNIEDGLGANRPPETGAL